MEKEHNNKKSIKGVLDMTQTLILIEIFFTVIMGLYFMNALKSQKSNKVVIDKENKKEIDTLKKLRSIKLTEPLTEKVGLHLLMK